MKDKCCRVLALLTCFALLTGPMCAPSLAEAPRAADAPSETMPDAGLEAETDGEDAPGDSTDAAVVVEAVDAQADAEFSIEGGGVEAIREPEPEEIDFELGGDAWEETADAGGGEPGVDAPAEPEQQPGEPLRLGGLSTRSLDVKLGTSVRWTVDSEGGDSVLWRAVRSDGTHAKSGTVTGGAFRWKPDATGVYLVTVTSASGDSEAEVSETIVVRKGRLSARVRSDQRYAVAGRVPLKYSISVTGGVEPYSVNIDIHANGGLVYTSNINEKTLTYMPQVGGEHTLKLRVVDAVGAKASGEVRLPVSVDERESRAEWEATLPWLDKDKTFAERLVRVARSQLGYTESTRDFIVGEDGKVDGYTRYGDWYHMPYEEWCAMFVSFCLHYAGIDRAVIPRHANCQRWKLALGNRYIDDEDNYAPSAGDIVFFHHSRSDSHADPNYPNHVGIVTRVDDRLHTIEGNTIGRSVREKEYALNDAHIVGYLSMRQVMAQHDPNYTWTNRVTFRAGDGIAVLVNGAPLKGKTAKAVNGSIAFELKLDEGLEVAGIRVSGGVKVEASGKGYRIRDILDDRIEVEITAAEAGSALRGTLGDGIDIAVEAPEGALPPRARLAVRPGDLPASARAVRAALGDGEAARPEGEEPPDWIAAWSLSFEADGEPVEPAGAVAVKVTFARTDGTTPDGLAPVLWTILDGTAAEVRMTGEARRQAAFQLMPGQVIAITGAAGQAVPNAD